VTHCEKFRTSRDFVWLAGEGVTWVSYSLPFTSSSLRNSPLSLLLGTYLGFVLAVVLIYCERHSTRLLTIWIRHACKLGRAVRCKEAGEREYRLGVGIMNEVTQEGLDYETSSSYKGTSFRPCFTFLWTNWLFLYRSCHSNSH
jgi:hypothetical protein